MNKLIYAVGGALLGAVAVSIYVRAAASDPEVWHKMPEGLQPGDYAEFAVRVLPGDTDLSQLDQIARTTPRTTVLAGSIEDDMITYVTRSAVMGFPDYTTVARRDGKTLIYARLRFGKADLGVNAARLDAWIAELTN